ncbi:GNAT family N-acetyltransferase [Paracoccus sp. S-4012]|uniref:GNAT family N-acetyltransferase n=1 Tax=Paracoccus sp. S-4012 TaxID=2665648 RepID=UPI0012B15D2D|nr:GNAT family N-acetyltransferase [Paracoccus sp. S-4012]MRX49428.1 GNAT family N-acetyltransferase [Paracoccus sp. S-4012]
MTPDDLAALHARCFTAPPPWSAAAFADILSLPGAFLILQPGGFLVGRVVADEAELLTLAVAPEARRHGLGRALCEGFAAAGRANGAASAFLEVAEDNAPARALYAAAGWREAGRRRGYYGPGRDAMILRLDLSLAEDSR